MSVCTQQLISHLTVSLTVCGVSGLLWPCILLYWWSWWCVYTLRINQQIWVILIAHSVRPPTSSSILINPGLLLGRQTQVEVWILSAERERKRHLLPFYRNTLSLSPIVLAPSATFINSYREAAGLDMLLCWKERTGLRHRATLELKCSIMR